MFYKLSALEAMIASTLHWSIWISTKLNNAYHHLNSFVRDYLFVSTFLLFFINSTKILYHKYEMDKNKSTPNALLYIMWIKFTSVVKFSQFFYLYIMQLVMENTHKKIGLKNWWQLTVRNLKHWLHIESVNYVLQK